MRFVLSLLLPFCFYCIPPFAHADRCDLTRELAATTSTIRKRAFKRDVPCEVQDADQIRAYLLRILKTKIPEGRLAYEALAYKTIGLIPPDFDYENGLISLYLGQLGAYYDPDSKRFYLADWISPELQPELVVHELTHALQDQFVDLNSFIDMAIENGDLLLARSALLEGDANSVALQYAKAKQSSRENVLNPKEEEGGDFEDQPKDGLPLSLLRIARFPYDRGYRFVQALIERGGYVAVDRALERPPRSSSEILHPEKYFSRVAQKGGFRQADEIDTPYQSVLYREVVGEFGVSALLSMYEKSRKRVRQAAQGWRDDRLFILGIQGQYPQFITWNLVWDSSADADEFVELYRQFLAKRYASGEIALGKDWVRLSPSILFRWWKEQTNLNVQFRLESE